MSPVNPSTLVDAMSICAPKLADGSLSNVRSEIVNVLAAFARFGI